MGMTLKVAALAAAAVLTLAACSSESEPDATEATGAAIDEQVGQVQAQVEELGARLDDVDIADLESRLSELESRVDLLVVAIEELQDPSGIRGSTSDAEATPEPDTEATPEPDTEATPELDTEATPDTADGAGD